MFYIEVTSFMSSSLSLTFPVSLESIHLSFHFLDGFVECFCCVSVLFHGCVEWFNDGIAGSNNWSLFFNQPCVITQFNEKSLHFRCVLSTRRLNKSEEQDSYHCELWHCFCDQFLQRYLKNALGFQQLIAYVSFYMFYGYQGVSSYQWFTKSYQRRTVQFSDKSLSCPLLGNTL